MIRNLLLSACVGAVLAAPVTAQSFTPFAFVDLAYQRGGAITRADVLPATQFGVNANRELPPERDGYAGDLGLGIRFNDRLFATISGGTSSRLDTRYSVFAGPRGAGSTVTSTNKRDSVMLMLGYQFYGGQTLSAYAAGGAEFSRTKVDSTKVNTFIYDEPATYSSRRISKTSAVGEVGLDVKLTNSIAVTPFARVFEGARSQYGVKLTVDF